MPLPHFWADDCGKVDFSRFPPILITLEPRDSRREIRNPTSLRREPRLAFHPSAPVRLAFGLIALPATGHKIRNLGNVASWLLISDDRAKMVPLCKLISTIRTANVVRFHS